MTLATDRRNRPANARSRRRAGATWVSRTPPTARGSETCDATLLVVLDGEVVGHVKGSEKRDYITDPLGSVVAYLNSSQTLTDQFEYWPYGELITEVETEVQPFLWVGSLGYFRDSDLRTYIRAREYRQDLGSWMQLDPLWPKEPAYNYGRSNPQNVQDVSGETAIALGAGGGAVAGPPGAVIGVVVGLAIGLGIGAGIGAGAIDVPRIDVSRWQWPTIEWPWCKRKEEVAVLPRPSGGPRCPKPCPKDLIEWHRVPPSAPHHFKSLACCCFALHGHVWSYNQRPFPDCRCEQFKTELGVCFGQCVPGPCP